LVAISSIAADEVVDEVKLMGEPNKHSKQMDWWLHEV
jgi:hypothetical protein